jgi:hypothetical protein
MRDNYLLLNPLADDGGGSNGSGGDVGGSDIGGIDDSSVPVNNSHEQGNDGSDVGGVEKPAAPTPSHSFTPEQLAQAMRSAVEPLLPKPAPTPNPQDRPLSQEEYDKIFERYNVTPEFAEKLGLQPQAAEMLNQLVQGIAKHADRLAQYRAFELQNKISTYWKGYQNEHLDPVLTAHRSAHEQKMESEFFETHADLKEVRPLLLEIKNNMVSRGEKFNTKQEVFKALAERARGILSKIPGSNNGTVGNNGQSTQGQTRQKMAPVSTGGHVSGGVGAKGRSVSTTAHSIFG